MNLTNVWYIWNKNAFKEHKAPVLLISYSKAKANEIASVLDTLMSPLSKVKEPYQVSKGVISNDDFKQALKDKSNKEVKDFAQKLIRNQDISYAKENIKIMRERAQILLEQKKATDDELKQIKSSLTQSQKKLNTASKNLSKNIINHELNSLNKYVKKFIADVKFDYKNTLLNQSSKRIFNKLLTIMTDILHTIKLGDKKSSDYKSNIKHNITDASRLLPHLYSCLSEDTLNDFETIKSDTKKLN